jgi:hypothetical protein
MEQLWQDEWAAQPYVQPTYPVDDARIAEARAFAEKFSDSWRETHPEAACDPVDSK